ncbi:uncharacterized protein LOC110442135 [Mizuhopecten yessoensis]|uniref:NTR domain-containing protein n=1 Tax=Mizuhopecten yessoensis TaxID=6573 RepID=A0A210PI33_MIZYE|nr:uncharacterized protein LOC110442135 [Mizuhopecten yessoensis]OWF36086.1 hypothetical protein KP79_PYT11742 [Mizuhopecten yessoensis]
MLLTFAVLLVFGSARLSHSLCDPDVLHPQTALCNQKYAFKGKVTKSTLDESVDNAPEGSTGVSYEVNVMKVFKDTESDLTEIEVITITTKGSMQNGIPWLVVGTKYFMTVSSSKTIDLCQSYVVEWSLLPLPKSVYKWRAADDTFIGNKNCDNCEINYGTPKNTAEVCDYNSLSCCHLYERCNYNENLGQCSWDKLPQKESGKDCEAPE